MECVGEFRRPARRRRRAGAGASSVVDTAGIATLTRNIWHSVVGSIDNSTGIGKLYFDDVDTGASCVLNGSAFTIPLNGKDFWVGSDTSNVMQASLADLFIASGVSLLVDGDIPEANRRLFIDSNGKPVDPAVAVASLGTPIILLGGDHAGFATNRGTGGTFTLTGALTDASTSPSD